MMKLLKPVIVLVSIFLLVGFIVIVINQTYQVVQLANQVHPVFGVVTLWSLIIIYSICVFVPLYIYFRVPSKLIVPVDQNSSEYTRYIQKLQKRLASNKHLKHQNLSFDTNEDLAAALDRLRIIADQDIQKTASIVFVSTAVSQSGKLDSIVVLVILSRMIWRISHIYNQRPSPREMLQLYANVAGTALVALELDEIDIGEQIEPIIDNVVSASVAGAIPGLGQITSFVFNSILDGAINAYLALRVGAITKGYCGSLVRYERKTLRRSASIEAANHLGKIITENTKMVSKKILMKFEEKFSEKFSEGKSKVSEKFEEGKKKISEKFGFFRKDK